MDPDPALTDPALTDPALTDPDAMTPLAFAPDPIRAQLLVALLESREVQATVAGAYASALGAYGGGGRATIYVRRADYERSLTELQAFLIERAHTPPGSPPRPAETCPVCGYDLRHLNGQTRCPECGIDQDALARVRAWIELAPPPGTDAGPVARTVEAVGVTMGRVMIVLFAIAIIALLVRFALFSSRP